MGDLTKQEAHPQEVRSAVHAEAALHLRMQGQSYAKIGQALGISKATAWRLVTDALQELQHTTRETVEELRALELARLDDLWRRLYPALPNQKLDVQAGRLMLRISMQRSLLLGLPVLRMPLGGDEVPVPGDVDLAKLSVEDLRQLEAILSRAGGGTIEALRLNPADEVFQAVAPAADASPDVSAAPDTSKARE